MLERLPVTVALVLSIVMRQIAGLPEAVRVLKEGRIRIRPCIKIKPLER